MTEKIFSRWELQTGWVLDSTSSAQVEAQYHDNKSEHATSVSEGYQCVGRYGAMRKSTCFSHTNIVPWWYVLGQLGPQQWRVHLVGASKANIRLPRVSRPSTWIVGPNFKCDQCNKGLSYHELQDQGQSMIGTIMLSGNAQDLTIATSHPSTTCPWVPTRLAQLKERFSWSLDLMELRAGTNSLWWGAWCFSIAS